MAKLKPWPTPGPSSVDGRGDSAAGHHEALVVAPAPVQFLDLVRRSVARNVSQARPPDVADAVRGTGRKVHRGIGSDDLLLATGERFSAALEDVVHRFDRTMLVESRAPARSDVDDCDDEFPRANVARRDELVGEAPISLESLRLLAWYDLHGSAAVCKVRRAFGVSVSAGRCTRVKGIPMGSRRDGPRRGPRLHADRVYRRTRCYDRPVPRTRREVCRHLGGRDRSGRAHPRGARRAIWLPPARTRGCPA